MTTHAFRKSRRVLASALLLAWAALPAFAREYYVATNGNDAQAGTQEQPFRSLRKAASVAQAGDGVLIRGGVYAEAVVPRHSGKPGQWIVYRPESKAGDVILKNPATKKSRSYVFFLRDLEYIRIQGLTFRDFMHGSAVAINECNDIEVVGCAFENIGGPETTASHIAVSAFRSGPGIVVRENRFRNIYGDAVKFSAVLQSAILNNDIFDLHTPNASRKTAADEGAPVAYAQGIKMSEWGKASGDGVIKDAGYNQIAYNVVHDFTGGGIHADVAACFDVYHHNVVRNIGGKAFFIESRCSYNLLYQNLVMDCGSAFNSCSGNGWTFGNQYFNNLAYRNGGGYTFTGTSHNVVRNNIAYANRAYQILVGPPAARIGHNVFENNLWYAPSSSAMGAWDVWKQPKDRTPLTFAQWTKVSGECHGLWADPKMLSVVPGAKPKNLPPLGKEDLHLAADSPARRAGKYGVDMGVFLEDGAAVNALPKVFFEKHATESTEGTQAKVQVKVVLDKPSQRSVTVKYGFEGAATRGVDYDAPGDHVVFQPGETEKTIDICVRDDPEQEQLELVVVDLIDADGAVIGMPRTHVHGIRDDDGKLAAPSHLTATRLPDGTVQLNWKDNSAIEQRYGISRRNGPSEEWRPLRDFDHEAWQVATNDTSYVDRSAKPDASYQYVVRASSLMRGQSHEGMMLMRGDSSEESNVAEVGPAAARPRDGRIK